MQVSRSMRPPVPCSLVMTIWPSGLNLGQREAHVLQPWNVDEARVGDVAPAHLGRALEQVTHDHALPETLPVVGPPAEMVHERREEQCRVGHPPRDHHIGARLQRGQQRIRAQIGIGRDQAAVQAAHRLVGIQQGHVVFTHPGQYVVARHHGHAKAGQPELARDIQHRLAGGERIRRAHVGDDRDALPGAGGQHGAHALLQQRVVPLPWIAAAPQLGQGNRALGQAFEHQRIQSAALGQVLRGVDAVAGIAGA